MHKAQSSFHFVLCLEETKKELSNLNEIANGTLYRKLLNVSLGNTETVKES